MEEEKLSASSKTDPQPGDPDASDLKLVDRYECGACGYIYEPNNGDHTSDIAPGTAFEALPEAWRCPVCGARKPRFNNVGPIANPSGFKQNYGYGFGVNTLTPNQKNLLIFGGLGLGALFFLSLYGLN